METAPIGEAIKWLEKSSANLEPELLSADAARELLAEYSRAVRLGMFGVAALARKVDDANEVAASPAPLWARGRRRSSPARP
jgi:hypothetical protein